MTQLENLISQMRDARSKATQGEWKCEWRYSLNTDKFNATAPDSELAEHAVVNAIFMDAAANNIEKLLRIIELQNKFLFEVTYQSGESWTVRMAKEVMADCENIAGES